MTIDQSAPVITRDQQLIEASLDTVWRVFTNIANWTQWNKDINQASLDGPLTVGSAIHWTTAGMDIVSTIGELVPQQRIVWSGETQSIMGIHHWQFTSVEEGTLVQTKESWTGDPVDKQVDLMQQGLDQSLRKWLESLKRMTENLA